MNKQVPFSEKDFPKRMNIHFCLVPILKEEIIRLNLKLVENGSEINFSANHVPHITILMGTINSLADYNKIVSKIETLCSKLETQKIVLSNPYSVLPKKKFVFLDVFPKNKIKKVKYKFFNVLKSYIKLDYYGNPHIHIHLTIGYIENLTIDTENLINKMNIYNTKSDILKIGISPVSEKGTCLKETFIFKLVLPK